MRHVILFDIDGTLIHGGGAGRAALLRALADVLAYPGPYESVSFSGRTDHAIMADFLALAGADCSFENRQRLVEAYLRHLPGCLRECPAHVLPGVLPLIAQLSRRPDVAIGLLTGNVREGAMVKLGHFGLWDYFPFGGFGGGHVCRDEVARSALADARRHLDEKHGPVWVIGDTPLDVRCARAIGASAVGVLTGWHGREEMEACGPDHLFDDLSDTERVLQLWT
jgi:phosphoglycolate phosphatase-like HAD superfamily hydrolase